MISELTAWIVIAVINALLVLIFVHFGVSISNYVEDFFFIGLDIIPIDIVVGEELIAQEVGRVRFTPSSSLQCLLSPVHEKPVASMGNVRALTEIPWFSPRHLAQFLKIARGTDEIRQSSNRVVASIGSCRTDEIFHPHHHVIQLAAAAAVSVVAAYARRRRLAVVARSPVPGLDVPIVPKLYPPHVLQHVPVIVRIVYLAVQLVPLLVIVRVRRVVEFSNGCAAVGAT